MQQPVTYDRVPRHVHQPTPPYRCVSSTLTTRTSSVLRVRAFIKSRKSGESRDIHLGRSTAKQKWSIAGRRRLPQAVDIWLIGITDLRRYAPFVVPVLTYTIGE